MTGSALTKVERVAIVEEWYSKESIRQYSVAKPGQAER